METNQNRRNFLATSTLAGAALALDQGGVYAAERNEVKVGLIGCGGRGTGAAANALKAEPYAKLVAMGDVFPEKLTGSLETLKRSRVKDQIQVPKEMQFIGMDAYKKVIEASDVVLLTTTPHFRPMHLAAAVEAGKHVFAEKPLAVDAPGVRSVIATAKKAKEKNLGLLVGFCYRWDLAKRETIKRIHDGAIGDVLALHVSFNTGELWYRPTQAKFNTMEYQMLNWYYFNWLSGDHIVEQHCHNHDKATWVLKGEMPIACTGVGGRQKRTDPKYGNIFDHHSVVYEYKSGVKVFSVCRQMNGTPSSVQDHVFGSNGSAQLMTHTIFGPKKWNWDGDAPSMYDQEHLEFFESIRAGKPINNGEEGARSTLMSIMGRMATYTGQRITWDMAMNSKEDLSPKSYDWAELEYAPPAIPGVTKFI
ncbi:MAG: Gfo/Idh/MocA family oxidoreductase [Zavarzinella sp.]